MRLLLPIASWCCLLAINCSAQPGGPVRPVGKGVKLGPFNKDHIAIAKPFAWSQTNFAGLAIHQALPAGVYRAKFEDNNGYYLPAPGTIAERVADSISSLDGGLYVRKDKPTVFYVYVTTGRRNTTTPQGDMVRWQQRLPRDFAAQLRQ